LAPAEGIPTALADGTRLLLHPRDWIEYRLLQRGTYEPKTLAFLTSNLKEGNQAVLAGVNIGLHVIVASRAVGAGGRVLGVEPQPASLLRARQNLALNRLPDNVLLVSAALGPQASLLPMAPAPSHNTGMATLTGEAGQLPFQVVVETLPEILYRLHLRRPDLMLLDVEGFELDVLKGVTSSSRPRILIVEVKADHQGRAGSSVEAVFGRLGSLGYQIFDLEGKPAKPSADLIEFNAVALTEDAPPVHWIK
jgi:FkbM family methyltransferase